MSDICSGKIEEMVRAGITAQNEWIEDILAGLLAAGVMRPEIEVAYLPDVVEVRVRGKAAYWRPLAFRG